ncbi:response regulator [bacterium]|nr:response regulator [bacterium]
MTYVQFSSFQIGKMLNVSRQAVNQWIDKGYIKSYRTPGGHRRVKREDLLSFLKTRNIPIPEALATETQEAPGTFAPRIMCLDDDNDFLTLMQHAIMAKLPTAQLTALNDGYDALVSIGASQPDLLVLDMRMPNIDGAEVCRRLKENPITSELPIIIVTGHDTPDQHEELAHLNVDEILSKSTPIDELAGQIADFVKDNLSGEAVIEE